MLQTLTAMQGPGIKMPIETVCVHSLARRPQRLPGPVGQPCSSKLQTLKNTYGIPAAPRSLVWEGERLNVHLPSHSCDFVVWLVWFLDHAVSALSSNWFPLFTNVSLSVPAKQKINKKTETKKWFPVISVPLSALLP